MRALFVIRSLGKEQIDENDFLSFIRQIQEFVSGGSDASEETMHDLRAAFQVFDLDGDGYITKEELRIAMEMIGEAVTEDQLTQFMTMADTDKDGRINYEGMDITMPPQHRNIHNLYPFFRVHCASGLTMELN